MLNKIKRLSAAFLALVIIVGSLGLTSAEAALAKPQNIRFVQWNKLDYSSATIAWNRVSGANWYYVRCCWTDSSHSISGWVKGDCNGVRINRLNYNHVYRAQVRGIYIASNGKRTYGPWSNAVYLTPWPKSVSYTQTKNMTAKLQWNVIYGCNGYNVFMTTAPSGKWYWNLTTSVKCGAKTGTVKKNRGSPLKKYTNYDVRVITRRKQNGTFRTVPAPYSIYYQLKLYMK